VQVEQRIVPARLVENLALGVLEGVVQKDDLAVGDRVRIRSAQQVSCGSASADKLSPQ
jgi:hypothetical protein